MGTTEQSFPGILLLGQFRAAPASDARVEKIQAGEVVVHGHAAANVVSPSYVTATNIFGYWR